MAILPIVRSNAAPLLALFLAGCGQSLEPGRYDFTTTGILQDSCSLEPSPALPLPSADVEVAGETVRLAFAAEGPLVPGLTGARGTKALIGRFLPDREAERFIADGNFDVIREIQGISCIVFSHSAIRARVVDPGSFAGTLRIDYSRRPEAQPECLANCVIEISFVATLAD